MNLSDLFAIPRQRDPQRPALRFEPAPGAARELTYEGLHRRAERLAAGLLARGLRPGDRVALYLGNSPELVVAHLAVLRLGAVTVPLNPAYRRREVAHVLRDAEPRLLVSEERGLPVLAELSADERRSVEAVLQAETLAAEEREPTEAPPRAGPDDLAMLLYTSGTSGRSKGAMLSHRNLLATVTALLAAWGWQASDELLLTLPLFHTHGLVVGLHCALAAGATVRLRPRFDAEAVAAALAASEATLFFGVPTMYVRLVAALRQGGAPALPRMRLFCSGSAPLPPEVFAAFAELTGHAILERYGMTETGMSLSNPLAGRRLPGTVGTPLPGVSMRVVDGDGNRVPPGVDGALQVRGSHVFEGYWRDPERTAAAFAVDAAGRRWFRTGDLARVEAESGHVTLLGRESELILCGGFNVYPREVEEVLAAVPGVREVAVAGAPDAELGEVPVAWWAGEAAVAAAALEAHCRRELARYKVPRAFHRVDALPRNAMGKLQKHLLKAPATAAAGPPS
ncbi:MAG TPA: AMP-binding protein [Thermoanaerobaculia bacterium]|nr:AMP-binding protein [Thermoanaerobaculia bacterium]